MIAPKVKLTPKILEDVNAFSRLSLDPNWIAKTPCFSDFIINEWRCNPDNPDDAGNVGSGGRVGSKGGVCGVYYACACYFAARLGIGLSSDEPYDFEKSLAHTKSMEWKMLCKAINDILIGDIKEDDISGTDNGKLEINENSVVTSFIPPKHEEPSIIYEERIFPDDEKNDKKDSHKEGNGNGGGNGSFSGDNGSTKARRLRLKSEDVEFLKTCTSKMGCAPGSSIHSILGFLLRNGASSKGSIVTGIATKRGSTIDDAIHRLIENQYISKDADGLYHVQKS